MNPSTGPQSIFSDRSSPAHSRQPDFAGPDQMRHDQSAPHGGAGEGSGAQVPPRSDEEGTQILLPHVLPSPTSAEDASRRGARGSGEAPGAESPRPHVPPPPPRPMRREAPAPAHSDRRFADEPQQHSGIKPPSWDFDPNHARSVDLGNSELRSEQIVASKLIAPRKIPSSRGWRRWLYACSFKSINVGESPDEQLVRRLNNTVAANLRGTYSIVVLGGKGGVGKTTLTAMVGSTFASLRGDKTIAIDANPDRASNLADRVDPQAASSYKEVLGDRRLVGYSDMRSHVGQNKVRLDVLGNRHQADRLPLNANTYVAVHERLQRFYSVLVSDSGTDVDHPVMGGLMGRADALVMVASTSPDGAKGAAELLDWAYEAGYAGLLSRTVVVINDVHGKGSKHDRAVVNSLVEQFSRWVGSGQVFVVPFDPHIATAGIIDLSDLRPATRRRLLEITAKIAGGFSSSTEENR